MADHTLLAELGNTTDNFSLLFKGLFVVIFLLIMFLSNDDGKKEMGGER